METYDALTVSDLQYCIKRLFQYDDVFLIQKRIYANEAVCCCLIIDNKIISLPILKVDHQGAFMDHNEKFKYKKYTWKLVNLPEFLQQRIESVIQKLYSFYRFKAYVRFNFLFTYNKQ